MSNQGHNELPEMALSAAQNAKLDMLLDAWRQQHQLAPAVVEQVRQNAIDHSIVEELPEDWWVHFSRIMNSVLANTNQMQQQLVDSCMFETQQWMSNWTAPSYGQNYLRPSAV
ncbi:MAG: hypothetical protein AAF639_33775 [Chloroflexota bacterium]